MLAAKVWNASARAGFEEAERVYAAPLDMDGVVLPKAMKVHNVEWIADGAARFIQNRAGGRPFCTPRFAKAFAHARSNAPLTRGARRLLKYYVKNVMMETP